ncbi:MAG TPA: hypothetical protein VJR58_33925 [Vineibacter sp.]|nr:hypothetical protein [Vineibacter sp.]
MAESRMLNPRTPVVIGVGQSVDRIDSPSYKTWAASDVAAAAAEAAFENTTRAAAVRNAIGAIVAVRTFEDTGRPSPFGKTANFPRSIAKRLGINPGYALWTKAGGNTPGDMMIEFSQRIYDGEFEVALLCGAEGISTVRNAQAQGKSLNFAEDPGGQVEDRGSGLEELRDPLLTRHGVLGAPISYALAENARRRRLGLSKQDYAARMGRLFEPFARVAAANPYSSWAVPAFSAAQLLEPGKSNRWIADPYPLRLVARDQVNQGAAVIVASLAAARAMGVPEENFVYLHGYAKAAEKRLLARPDIGASPTAHAAVRAALNGADTTVDDIALFDFYSCFPIAVANVVVDELSLKEDDPRGFTVTGGLPFFGGPGNNYSMHGIAEMAGRLRRQPGKKGFVGANGGTLGKYSAGVYSTQPRDWTVQPSTDLQATLDAVPSVVIDDSHTGPVTVETYTVVHSKTGPQYAVAIGKNSAGARVIARTPEGDTASAKHVHEADFLGRCIDVAATGNINVFQAV